MNRNQSDNTIETATRTTGFPRWSEFVVSLLAVCVLMFSPNDCAADERADVSIEEVRWGFDGKAQVLTFVPLSVLVQNNLPGEFEGTLRLTRSIQYTKQVDAVIEQDVYLGPLSSRWVQLVPYVFGDWEQWQLTWKEQSTDPFNVATPNLDERATVLLYDPDVLQTSGGVLPRFPADLFPTNVTALDGLRGVVLDRAPRWQGARRQAFLDWLRLGGRVYLLHDEQGLYPKFGDSLSALDREADRFAVGAGLVHRLPRTARSFDKRAADAEIFHDEQSRFNSKEWRQFRESAAFSGTAPQMNLHGWSRDADLLDVLQKLSRFRRNWILIYGLSLLYVLALFPGCYWLGRRQRTYQWFYLGFLIVVGLFSAGFISMGRLGVEDLARIRSVAIARQLDDGLYSITGWSSAAAKIGGDYAIEHSGTGRVYTAGEELGAVKGRIVSGPNGRLVADMPPASTRSVIYRARQEGPPLGINVERISIDAEANSISQLAISTGPDFPDDPIALYIWYEGRVHELQPVGQEWQLVPTSRKEGVAFLSYFDSFKLPLIGWTPRGFVFQMYDDEPSPVAFEELGRSLIGNSFGLNNAIDPFKLMLSPDIMRVFVYAPLPPDFLASQEEFPDQYGCVLYAVDLPTSPTARVRSPESSETTAQPEATED